MFVLGLAAGCCFLAGEVERQQQNQNGTSSSSSSGSGSGSGGEDDGSSKGNHTAVVVLVTLAAVVVFASLLLLLLRFLLRRGGRGQGQGAGAGGGGGHHQEESSAALQRQLQQLFHLHDSGLDQDVIDALPVFMYRELVVGAGAAKEPFDCAVCLCEFAGEDRLRLLPPCGHAFHVDCIDTWLLSSSTCPLCRCALGADDAAAFGALLVGGSWGHHEGEDAAVLPVRLGKFKSLARAAAGPVGGENGIVSVTSEAGETSGSSLDARRCYSMGSYQYVLAEASLQVSVHRRNNGRAAAARPRGAEPASAAGGAEGKRIGAGSKGDSFSVSKIWQWPRNGKGKLPVLASDDSPSVNARLPWQRSRPGDS